MRNLPPIPLTMYCWKCDRALRDSLGKVRETTDPQKRTALCDDCQTEGNQP